MFGEIRESTGGKGGGIIEGEVVEEMRKIEGQGAQDRNTGGECGKTEFGRLRMDGDRTLWTGVGSGGVT